jgi:hypothetical protein
MKGFPNNPRSDKRKRIMKKKTRGNLTALAGLCAAALAGGASGAALEVKLGETISRTWDDVEKDGYAYAPKQEHDPQSGKTRVWLPYGTRGVYYETTGLSLSDPGAAGTGVALATTIDGETSGRLVYKLRFDKPVGAFVIRAGWSEWGVGGGTVGGAEYSVDGRDWTVLREIAAAGIVEPLLDPAVAKAEGLHTRELYIRFFSRDKADPAAAHGPNRWMKLRLSGDPAWGDRAETFFSNQVQVWLTPSDRPGDAPAGPEPSVPTAVRADVPPLNNTGPWAVASGAEWGGDHPRFNPLLKEAGVRWLRHFPEWQTIQPRQGEWRWEIADAMVADARGHGIQTTGLFAYFAPWASADGGTRRGPVKDIRYWRDYVRATTARYRNDIRHWEVWNEFNGSFYQGIDKPREYAELTVAAFEEARRTDPGIAIGIGVANFDLGFLDAAIKAGAADHFDFVCVHPYENAAMLASGGETGFLSLAANLRRMLEANKQRRDIPLWITETGYQAPVEPDAAADALQAEVLAKTYLLAMAQGFERVFWFEARGPAYGHGTDHGLIRRDWTVRPAFTALRTLARTLGENPRYDGWLQTGDKGEGYGFVFDNGGKPVLAAWMPPGDEAEMKFDDDVSVVDLAGQATTLAAGRPCRLGRVPILIAGLPHAMAEEARSRKARPFPWGTDYGAADEVSCRLGAVNNERGVRQVHPQTTAVVNDLAESWRRTNFAHGDEGHYIYFRVDPAFAGFGRNRLAITVVAKRPAPDQPAGMNLCYESLKGYRNAGSWFAIPAEDGWHEHTWTVDDANFVGAWGWNFRLDTIASPGEVHVREVRVRRLDPPATAGPETERH